MRALSIAVALVLGAIFAAGSLLSADEPLEYQLAVIDSGYVAKDDPQVARFKTLLDRLSSKYAENRQQIADMTVAIQGRLRESGINVSLMDIMRGMDSLFSERNSGLKYAEYIAFYSTSRRNGSSHIETLDGIKAILEAFGVK